MGAYDTVTKTRQPPQRNHGCCACRRNSEPGRRGCWLTSLMGWGEGGVATPFDRKPPSQNSYSPCGGNPESTFGPLRRCSMMEGDYPNRRVARLSPDDDAWGKAVGVEAYDVFAAPDGVSSCQLPVVLDRVEVGRQRRARPAKQNQV